MTLLDDPDATLAATAPEVVVIDAQADEADLIHTADRLHQLREAGIGVVLDLGSAGELEPAALGSFLARLSARPELPPVPAACPDQDVARLARLGGAPAGGVVLLASLADALASAR